MQLYATRMGRAWPTVVDVFNKVDLILGRKNDGKRQIAEGKRVPFNKGFPGEYGNVQGC